MQIHPPTHIHPLASTPSTTNQWRVIPGHSTMLPRGSLVLRCSTRKLQDGMDLSYTETNRCKCVPKPIALPPCRDGKPDQPAQARPGQPRPPTHPIPCRLERVVSIDANGQNLGSPARSSLGRSHVVALVDQIGDSEDIGSGCQKKGCSRNLHAMCPWMSNLETVTHLGAGVSEKKGVAVGRSCAECAKWCGSIQQVNRAGAGRRLPLQDEETKRQEIQ